MKFTKTILGTASALAIMASAALADPAIIYDLGGKFDKSFNEAAFAGAEKWAAETGKKYREIELSSEAQREQALRRFAEEGDSPILVVGFSFASSLATVAKDFPNTHFAIVDMVVDAPNVRSIVFNENEGSYLVGMLAAMASKTGKVGFVGGMDIPLIRKFACGYVEGVKAVNPSATVFQNMAGTTGAAWNDPVKGGELTRAQIDQGADVIYHAAGGTGRGVLQAAADAGKLGIGVDSNQDYMFPGHVLTSMLKRVDVAVYNTFKDGTDGNWTSGFNVLGLANDGVGYAMDEFNKDLITPEMVTKVEAAKADIISGKIMVHDYMSDNACPVQ